MSFMMGLGAHRFWLSILLISLTFFLGGCRCGSGSKAKEAPIRNVILVVIETLRLDRLGVYGRNPSITPNIDKLARKSVVYTGAHAASSWTKTSVASILTGLNPYRHQVLESGLARGTLPESAVTLAELLKKNGFHTAAVAMNPHVSKISGYSQGFDEFVHRKSWIDETTDWATKKAINYFKKADRSRKHFFYLHYLDPHDPWPRRKQCSRFLSGMTTPSNDNIGQGWAFRLSGEKSMKKNTKPGLLPVPSPLSETDLAYLEGLYDCEVAMMDRALGRLLDYLENSGWMEDALVVVTADHGEEFLDHGLLRHGYQLFEETTHVPLVIRARNHQDDSHVVVDETVSMMDIAPTIYRLLGIDAGNLSLDGTILPGFTASPQGKARKAIAFGMTQFGQQDRAYFIRNSNKVIHDYKRNKCDFFDLRTDPLEKQPVACSSHGVGKKLHARLNAIRQKASNRALSKNARESDGKDKMDATQKKQLEALGYFVD